LENDPF